MSNAADLLLYFWHNLRVILLIFAGDRDSETSDIALRREAALMKEDDLEIDDDEEGMEEGGVVTGEPGK